MSPPAARVPLTLRRAEPADRPHVLELLRASLGQSEEHHEEFFRWKHDENPFGPSPAWVATAEDRIVGFRTFMRWRFRRGDGVLHAVRAVDTATHPEFQGRGIFRDLTMLALDELRDEGVDFVFNTPNDQSRPGYLKMGWHEVGRLPVSVRARSPLALVKIARARVPAERWSLPTSAGIAAADALADEDVIAELMNCKQASDTIRTDRTAAFLRWRYAGFEPVAYRAVSSGDGLVMFRLRRRGVATEAVVGDAVAAGGDQRAWRRLLSQTMRTTGADYAIRLGDAMPSAGYLPMPGNGPMLTQRPIRDDGVAPQGDWALEMGDVELF